MPSTGWRTRVLHVLLQYYRKLAHLAPGFVCSGCRTKVPFLMLHLLRSRPRTGSQAPWPSVSTSKTTRISSWSGPATLRRPVSRSRCSASRFSDVHSSMYHRRGCCRLRVYYFLQDGRVSCTLLALAMGQVEEGMPPNESGGVVYRLAFPVSYRCGIGRGFSICLSYHHFNTSSANLVFSPTILFLDRNGQICSSRQRSSSPSLSSKRNHLKRGFLRNRTNRKPSFTGRP